MSAPVPADPRVRAFLDQLAQIIADRLWRELCAESDPQEKPN